jgi:hypothetical protein
MHRDRAIVTTDSTEVHTSTTPPSKTSPVISIFNANAVSTSTHAVAALSWSRTKAYRRLPLVRTPPLWYHVSAVLRNGRGYVISTILYRNQFLAAEGGKSHASLRAPTSFNQNLLSYFHQYASYACKQQDSVPGPRLKLPPRVRRP